MLSVQLEVVIEHRGKERENHAEADEIDEDRQKDDTEREALSRGLFRWLAQGRRLLGGVIGQASAKAE